MAGLTQDLEPSFDVANLLPAYSGIDHVKRQIVLIPPLLDLLSRMDDYVIAPQEKEWLTSPLADKRLSQQG